jgi:hypothetical protein
LARKVHALTSRLEFLQFLLIIFNPITPNLPIPDVTFLVRRCWNESVLADPALAVEVH